MSTMIAGRRWRGALLAVAALALGLAVMGTADRATAADGSPCVESQKRPLPWAGKTWTEQLYKCPLVQGNVPVRESRDPKSRVVGRLKLGGRANWFIFEMEGKSDQLRGHHNNW
jgi:hypothetical protein